MATFSFLDALCIILLILSLGSFLPQLQRVWKTQTSSGISLYHVLFNLIAATEQFTIWFGFLVDLHPPGDGPQFTTDWLNLCQTTVVWLMFLLHFALCLLFCPDTSHTHKALIAGLYFAFSLVSVIPVLFYAVDLYLGSGDKSGYNGFAIELFLVSHIICANYPVTLLAIIAVYCQIRKILSSPPGTLTGLSRVGLAVQATVFCLVAVSWVFRVRFPLKITPGLSGLDYWFKAGGYLAVENMVFALGQALVWWVVRRRAKGEEAAVAVEEVEVGAPDGPRETDPLLG